MKSIKLIFIITILCSKVLNSQNIFPEKFDGCNTEQFSIENDSVIAKINPQEFIKIIFSNVDAKIKGKIDGSLSFQIVVDKDGKSCLLSLENKTNIKTKALNLKTTIDNNLTWSIPKERVSPIIILKFKNREVFFTRLGLNGNIGWHEIDKT